MKHEGRFDEDLALQLMVVYNDLMTARSNLLAAQTKLRHELAMRDEMLMQTARQILHLGRFLNGFGVSLPDESAFEAACAQVH